MTRQIIIRNQPIDTGVDELPLDDLLFLKENPRVYAHTYGVDGFAELSPEEQQEKIFEKLKLEESVKRLLPEIQSHGGLIEPILVRVDTREVIEGNSRLAAYRILRSRDPEGPWERIRCDIVSGLTDDQLSAYLNQIHVKGKTKWSAYEKANFSYVRKKRGMKIDDIAELFDESPKTIRIRTDVIEMMKENGDNTQEHFSYYDVIVRTPKIGKAMKDERVRNKILKQIRNLGSSASKTNFTAQDLRRKLPVILEKNKVRKDWLKGGTDLDTAYQRAKISRVEDTVRRAKELLSDISDIEVERLEPQRLNAFRMDVRKLAREVERVKKMVKK